MPSFKTVAATVAGLAAVNASSYKHEPVYAHMRSALEDLDLAEGRNPFTGKAMGHDDLSELLKMTGNNGGNSHTTITVNGKPFNGSDKELDELLKGFGGFGGFKGFGDDDDFFGGRMGGRLGGRLGGRTGGRSPFGGFDDEPLTVGGRRPTTVGKEGEEPVAPTHPEGETLPVGETEPEGETEEEDVPSRQNERESLEELLKRLSGGSFGRGGFEQEPVSKEPLKMDNPAGSPFRIKVDYSTFRAPSEKHANYVKNLLMPAVTDFFTTALKIKYPLKQNQRTPRYSNVEIPETYITEGVKDADLVILVRCENDPRSGVVASAGSLVADARSGRSVLATVNFNFGHIPVDENDYMALSKSIYTTVHELTHVLGFSNDQFPNYLNADGTRQKKNTLEVQLGGDTLTLLNVEPLTTRLRKHFGCDKIQGAPLEDDGDEGTAGSHFERRIFFNEYMTGSEMHDSRISEMTLALLEGTGWYVVDYTKAEPYTVGKGEGCDYFFGQCKDSKGQPKFNEFCARDDDRACTNTYGGIAVCQVDPWSNGCGMPYAQEELDCRTPEASRYAELLRKEQVFGLDKGSKCFMGNVVEKGFRANQKSTYCFNFKCNGTGATTELDVIIGKSIAKCTKKESIEVEGYSGKIDCPDPVEFCAIAAPYCSKGCLGRGECVQGVCHCKDGFSGPDCVYPKKH